MVCILAKGSVIATSPAYHDHSPQMLLQNFPDTTIEPGRIGIIPTESGGGGKRFQPCRQLSVVSPSNNAVILTKRARVIERKWLRARTKRAYSVVRQFADALGCFVTEFLSSVQEVVTRLPNVVLLDPGRRYHRRQNRTGNQPGDADQPGISRQLMANLIARPADEVACSPRPGQEQRRQHHEPR
jgi:hypothetical protein